jgi:hypothetical protein
MLPMEQRDLYAAANELSHETFTNPHRVMFLTETFRIIYDAAYKNVFVPGIHKSGKCFSSHLILNTCHPEILSTDTSSPMPGLYPILYSGERIQHSL